MPPTTRKTPSDRQPPRKRTASKRTVNPQVSDTRIPSAEDGDYAPTAWGSKLGAAEDLIMPSGQKALVKRPGVEGLMKAGVLNDVDSLTALVDQTHLSKGNQINVKSLMGDESALVNLVHVVDRVMCHVVQKPAVFMTPNDITTRKDGVVYCDMIELEDKMFIFNFAIGGTRDFEQFRKESESAVGDLELK
jgi:hypothetical protein